MTIGILKLFLFIPQSNSLKEKRMILNSFKQKMRNNFNVSITSLDEEDKWQKEVLAVVCVGNNSRAVSQLLTAVVNFAEDFNHLQLLDYSLELI
ncbi:MAG: DUF503 domain-containing protein [Candidatus Omnitrophica bacterium]|nr:DUF503 domain-containing protein [Candidatus Omnitrophota bacterium]